MLRSRQHPGPGAPEKCVEWKRHERSSNSPTGRGLRKAGSSSRSSMEVCQKAINLQSGGPSASAAIIERARSPAMGTDGRLQQCCCCCCSRSCSCSCRAAVCRWPQRKSAALDEFKSMARAFSLTCSLPFSDLSLLHGQGPGPRASLLARSNPSTVVAGKKTAIIWIDRAGSRLPSNPSVHLCTCAERLFCSVSGCFNSV